MEAYRLLKFLYFLLKKNVGFLPFSRISFWHKNGSDIGKREFSR